MIIEQLLLRLSTTDMNFSQKYHVSSHVSKLTNVDSPTLQSLIVQLASINWDSNPWKIYEPFRWFCIHGKGISYQDENEKLEAIIGW